MIAILLTFLVLLVIGIPIAFALGLAAYVYVIFNTSLPPLIVFQRMFASIDSFPFMAIPFFMLAGNLMFAGGLADKIIDLSKVLVGHMRGGLANVSIVASMFFGGVSGSSVADASALGTVLVPAMKRQGYSSPFSAAINATSSTVGIIIPPSIPMILTGVATGLSIRELFFGGLLPGILVGIIMLITTTVISTRHNLPRTPRASIKQMLLVTLRATPALIMVFIILGGILLGIFTPTEASVVAALYGLLTGFLYRGLTWEKLHKAFIDSAISSAVVMMVIATAGVLTWLLAFSRIPQALAVYLSGVIDSPVLLMVILATAFLIAGTVLDVSPAVLLFGPILLPVVQAIGVDPIFFGVIMVFALSIGLFTPPVGTTLIISAYISGDSVLSVARNCLPYLISMIVLLYLLIFCSDLVLWIPTALFR